MGRKAYGRADCAPFFTEELLACLARRSAASWLDGNTWSVTTDSLRTALLAASPWRTEEMSADPALSPAERATIQFSIMMPGTSTFTAELCQIEGPPDGDEPFDAVQTAPAPEREDPCRAFSGEGGGG